MEKAVAVQGKERMTITGTTRFYPLIGYPIVQVKTPPLINGYFAEKGIDAVLIPLEITPQGALAFFDNLRHWSNCGGCSITIPHKQAAFEAMDTLTPRARLSRSVNTVRRDAEGRLHGDMTDGAAFVSALTANGFDPTAKHAAVIGAGGGAGASICEALCAAGVASLVVIEADARRRDIIVKALGDHYSDVTLSSRIDDAASLNLLVNATPLGMKPDDPLPFDPANLPPGAMVADVVTKPEITRLLEAAQVRGLPIQTGMDMARAQLGHQIDALGISSLS